MPSLQILPPLACFPTQPYPEVKMSQYCHIHPSKAPHPTFLFPNPKAYPQPLLRFLTLNRTPISKSRAETRSESNRIPLIRHLANLVTRYHETYVYRNL